MRTRFTSSGVRIAYQTVGDGDLDVVLVPGLGSHVELHWCEPNYARFMRELASYGRLIVFDKRGTGRSERIAGIPSLEERMEDLTAVLDAAGSARALVIGISEGAALAALFAATYPARTRGLVLCSSFPTGSRSGDYLGAVRPEQLEHALEVWESWGSGRSYEIYAPGLVGNRVHRHFLAVFERAAASRQTMAALVDALFEIDIRHILPLVQVPAVMLHRVDEIAPIESARQMAALMPNCRLIELEGDDHVPFSGPGAAVIREEIARFVSELRSESFTRAVGTVMFTDIVDSTAKAAQLGDRRWLALLDEHDELTRRCLGDHGGREVKSTGDGFLTYFNGPAQAVRCGVAVTQEVRSLGLDVRAGIHTGELELADGEARGLAVHVGARVVDTAGPGEVRVSAAVKDLAVGAEIRFEPQPPQPLKGLPGEWELYSVAGLPSNGRMSRESAIPERLSLRDRFEVWFAGTFPWSARAVMRLTQGGGARPG